MHDLSVQKWKDTIGFRFIGELDRGLNAVQVTVERLDIFRMKANNRVQTQEYKYQYKDMTTSYGM